MFHMNDCVFISEINETCVEKVLCIFLPFSWLPDRMAVSVWWLVGRTACFDQEEEEEEETKMH